MRFAFSLSAAVAVLLAGWVSNVAAQSGTTTYPSIQTQSQVQGSAGSTVIQGSGSTIIQGSETVVPGGSATVVTKPLSLQGYCVVCLKEMKKWVRGKSQFTSEYDGRVYYFPGEEQKQMFDQQPAKYAPVFGGNDVVSYQRDGKTVPGNLNYGLLADERYYFFATPQNRQEFRDNRAKYAQADIALQGNCPVCLVEMNKTVPGDTNFVALHNDMRYLFPGQEQLEMFKKDRAKYTKPAFGGYCPVCIRDMRKWVKGRLEFTAYHHGKAYVFPGQSQKEAFQRDPGKYVPVLDGDCAVCLKEMGERKPGSVRFAAYHQGQLYLFPGQDQKEMFLKDPAKYAVTD